MRIYFLSLLVPLILFAGCSGDDNPSTPSFTDPQLTISLDQVTIPVDGVATLTVATSGIKDEIFAISFELTLTAENWVAFQPSNAVLGNSLGNDALLFAQQEGTSLHATVTRVAGSDSDNNSGTLLTIPLRGLGTGSGRLEIDPDAIWFFDESGDQLEYTPQSTTSLAVTVEG